MRLVVAHRSRGFPQIFRISRACGTLLVPDNPSGLKSKWKRIAPPTQAGRKPNDLLSPGQAKRHPEETATPYHATPCKGKSKHNTLCFNTFALSRRKLHGTLYPGRHFACHWAMNFCPPSGRTRCFLTSSSCHPKVFVKEFSYFLMPCHQHCLGVNLLVQR